MECDASASPVPPKDKPTNSEEPVKIKEEVIDPGYKSASTAFEVTTKILATAMKSETEIKKEVKEEPMDASESDTKDHKTKMPLPKVEVKKSDGTRTRTPSMITPLQLQRARLRTLNKMKKKGVYEPASSGGYYPPASVIWQRVPYLKPRHTKARVASQYYMNRRNWKSQKQQSPNTSQPNKDHSTHQLHIVDITEDDSPSDDNMDNENPLSNTTETSDKASFFMFLENLPKTWNEAQVGEFLEKENASVKEFQMMRDSELNFSGTIQMEFETFEQREEAKKKLHDKVIEGETLTAELIDSNHSDSDSVSSEPSIKRKKVNIEAAYRPDIDIWEKDPKGLYGLKPEFLQSLGITPPIDRWVQVTNFRCDKSELKEVMELAGEVLLCTVLTINHKTAKVMYSHPLEAVQAVSMLHKQNFYGQSLNVTMERCLERQIILPKGLQSVGPGLGQNGATLRDIVRHYERFAKGRSSSINFNIFRDINFKMNSSDCDIDLKTASSDIGSVQPKNEPGSDKQESNGPFLPNPCNPMVNPNVSIPGSTGPKSGPSGPMSGPGGPMSGPGGPMAGPSDPMSGPSGSMSGPSGPMSRPSGPVSGPSGPMSGTSGPNGPISGLNSPIPVLMPVNGGPIRNQMRPNVSPMPYHIPVRPGFGPNQNRAPMMAQGSRIPRQMGPMPGQMGPAPGQMGPVPGQMGPVPGQFQVPGPPGHFPVQTQIPGPMVNQPGPMVNQPGPMANHSGPMANQPGPMANQPRPMVRQPGPMANQPGPMVNHPGPMANHSGPMANQPGPMANQPGPMANQPSRFPSQPQPPGVSGSPRQPGPMAPGPRPMVGNNVPAMTMNSANCPGPIPQSQENCTVEISNLPSNTTFPFLSEKLSSCGQLMSLQMTRDRALAQFATRGHAENCYKQFNQLKVSGTTLQVKFV